MPSISNPSETMNMRGEKSAHVLEVIELLNLRDSQCPPHFWCAPEGVVFVLGRGCRSGASTIKALITG